MTEMPVLTEYQENCRNMYKTGSFDLDYINKGFVDYELDYYKPIHPNHSFEITLKTYIKYMASPQYQKKSMEQREKDKRSFEHDNELSFKNRHEIVEHNKRCFAILTEFLKDLDPADLPRISKIKAKITEFERIINTMPEYKEPDNFERQVNPYMAIMALAVALGALAC